MNLGIVANYGYRWILIPGLMGIFFGIGHFLTYFFFSKEVFGKFEKKKPFDKEHISTWSPDIHKVLSIVESLGQQFYRVEGYDKLLMRSDIFLTTHQSTS